MGKAQNSVCWGAIIWKEEEGKLRNYTSREESEKFSKQEDFILIREFVENQFKFKGERVQFRFRIQDFF